MGDTKAMTSDEVNALPERVRRYIHDLETRCDPAGEVRALWAARENLAAMTEKYAELEERMNVVLRAGPSTSFAVSIYDRARRAEVRLAEVWDEGYAAGYAAAQGSGTPDETNPYRKTEPATGLK